jgi:hypothetical protein
MFGEALILLVCAIVIVAHWLTVRQFAENSREIRIKLAALEVQLEGVRQSVAKPKIIEGSMLMDYQGQRIRVRVILHPTRWG